MKNNTLWLALDMLPNELEEASQWVHDTVDWFIIMGAPEDRGVSKDIPKTLFIMPDDPEDWDHLGTLDGLDDLMICAEFDNKLATFVKAHVIDKKVFCVTRDILDTLEERAVAAEELAELDNDLAQIFRDA